jgi:hypothetical protein
MAGELRGLRRKLVLNCGGDSDDKTGYGWVEDTSGS